MSGAAFILAISLAVAALLAVAFAAVAIYDRARRAARWVAASYAVIGLAVAVELLTPVLGLGNFGLLATVGGFLAAVALLNAGIAVRGDRQPPWPLIGVVIASSLGLVALSADWPQGSAARQFASQPPMPSCTGSASSSSCASGRRAGWTSPSRC